MIYRYEKSYIKVNKHVNNPENNMKWLLPVARVFIKFVRKCGEHCHSGRFPCKRSM